MIRDWLVEKKNLKLSVSHYSLGSFWKQFVPEPAFNYKLFHIYNVFTIIFNYILIISLQVKSLKRCHTSVYFVYLFGMGLFLTITKCLIIIMFNMFLYIFLQFRQLHSPHESQTRLFDYLDTACYTAQGNM